MTCKYTQLVPEDMIVIASVILLFAESFFNMNVQIAACLIACSVDVRQETASCCRLNFKPTMDQ
jgi:hypothetical protein